MLISFFEQLTAETLQLSDDQFVRQIEWLNTAPADVQDAAKDGDILDLGRALQQHLLASTKPRHKVRLQGLWSESTFAQTDRGCALAGILSLDDDKKSESRSKDRKVTPSSDPAVRMEENLTRWLIGIERGATLTAYEQLLLGDVMLSCELSPQTFFKLWRVLLTAAIELSCQLQNQLCPESAELRLIVIGGELPWRAGHLFDTVVRAKRLRERGCQFLHELVIESTDTDGAPRVGLMDGLPYWIGSLVRSTLWARAFRVELWDEAIEERFADVVRRAVTLCRSDGCLPFSDTDAADTIEILQAAARVTGFKKKSAIRTYAANLKIEDAEATAGGRNSKSQQKTQPKPKSKKSGGQPTGSKKPGFQSDWSQIACLRNRVAIDSDQIIVRHDTVVPELDVSVMGIPLLEGAWDLAVCVDDQPVSIAVDWKCSCWHSDKDSDYMELQLQLDEVRVDRQILLSRKHHFMILGDVLSGSGKTPVSLESSIRLNDAIDGDHDVRTRELRLHGETLSARVIPLGLDQDRVVSTPGACSFEDGRLRLSQHSECGLYAPLLIDWHPDRQSEACEWTKLTVTESRTIVTPNIATGYRIRTGLQQLLIYRSLQEAQVPRAVLGHHTSNETVIAHFRSTGVVDPIVLVE